MITLKKVFERYFGDNEEYDYFGYEIISDSKKVGTIEVVDHFNDDNDVCYVERIDIDSEYRNRGIGTYVLSTLLYDECGYYTVVVAPDSEDSKRLYERIGQEGFSDYNLDYMDQGYGVYSI